MNKRFSALDITYASMFVALMAIGANITSWLPFLQVAGVPLSMAPFFCVLAGLLLGPRLAAISMFVYMILGIAGAPIFSAFKAGFGVIIGNTGGFIISYIFAAWIAGLIMEKSKKTSLFTYILAAMAGTIVIYFIGTNYMYLSLNVWLGVEMAYSAAWVTMAAFALKDFIFTLVCAVLAPKLYKALWKNRALPSAGKVA